MLTNALSAVAWHPIHHDLLVSGGAEGSLIYWLLSSPTPRATLEEAHDSNVWSLAFHPLGHILVSASNDHTTRFWSRERTGDATSVFSGGGEKPKQKTRRKAKETYRNPSKMEPIHIYIVVPS